MPPCECSTGGIRLFFTNPLSSFFEIDHQTWHATQHLQQDWYLLPMASLSSGHFYKQNPKVKNHWPWETSDPLADLSGRCGLRGSFEQSLGIESSKAPSELLFIMLVYSRRHVAVSKGGILGSHHSAQQLGCCLCHTTEQSGAPAAMEGALVCRERSVQCIVAVLAVPGVNPLIIQTSLEAWCYLSAEFNSTLIVFQTSLNTRQVMSYTRPHKNK